MLIDENRWRAMRYSYEEGLIDLARGEVVPYAELLNELIDFVQEDAEALGCLDEILGLRDILSNKTSAHRQLDVYYKSLKAGADHDQGLRDVVDWLIEETVRNI
jgi:carboxylate-amine ligase